MSRSALVTQDRGAPSSLSLIFRVSSGGRSFHPSALSLECTHAGDRLASWWELHLESQVRVLHMQVRTLRVKRWVAAPQLQSSCCRCTDAVIRLGYQLGSASSCSIGAVWWSSAERRSLVGVKQHSVLSGDEALKQSDSEQQGCSEPQDAKQGHQCEQKAAHCCLEIPRKWIQPGEWER